MKKHLLIYLLACATFSAYAQAPGFSFAKRIGGASTEYNTDLHRTKDSQENLFVSGTFGETCDFDPGPGTQTRTSTGFLDIYVAKYDSSGNFLWVKTFGSAAQSDYSFCSTLDPSGNIVVTGYISGVVDLDPGPGVFSTTGAGFHAFAVKLGANGTFLWGKQFDSNASLSTDQVFIQAAASASDNSIYLGGYFGGSVDFDPGAGISGLTAGSGTRNGFILKLLPNGDFAWAFSLFNTVETAVNDICIDTDGNLNMVGRFSGTQDFDPSAFGIFNLSASQGSAFIWKLTSGGTYQAAYALRAINSGSSCTAGHIRVDKNKNILVNGSFTDKVDFDPNPTITNNYTSSAPTCYVLKINSAGSFSWLRMISATVASFSADMEVENTDNGYIYLAGSFEGTLNFSLGSVSASKTSVGQTDGFAIRIDSNGRTNWVKTFGSLFADKGRSIELTSKRNVVVLGDFQSTVDFNTDGVSQPLTSAGSWDGFVLKFNGADVQPVCPPTSVFTNCSGTISDGSGAANYANNLNCNWSIHSPGASSITITFTEFETEALYDYVRIYSGTSTADSLIKSFSGPGSLQKFNVPGEHVFITFSSDQSANGAGFSLNYRCNFNAKPEAAFSSAQQNFSAGGATRFTDLSTNLPTSWKWSFPGAFPSSSTLESPPNITFPASGCYTVTLIVGNALGFDTVTQTCYISTTPLASCSELFFSEYVEGSGNNKVIEIFNPLETSKSLSGYTLEIYSNGDLSPTTTWTLSGSIAAKDVYVFANSTADASV
jgi:PKD repeat protein